MIVSTQELAKLFDVTSMTINNWRRKGMPRESFGKFDLAKVIEWKISEAREEASIEEAPEGTSPKDRKDLAEAKLKEIKVAKERKELIPQQQANERLQKHLEDVRRVMLSAPGAHAHEILDIETLQEAQLVLEKIIHKLLDEMRKPINYPDFAELIKLEEKLENAD